jgi:hypothetical protein
MKTISLEKFEIKKLTDKYGKEFFLIVDSNDPDSAYFCFSGLMKEG